MLIRVKTFKCDIKEMRAVDDAKIVDMYLSRNEEAIARTAEKYGKRLRMLSFGIVKDIGAAEECENDVYNQAWISIPPNEPKEYFYAYLAKIARNISLNYCRERKRLKRSADICELSAEMEECIPAPDDCECQLDKTVLAEAINGFLASISIEKRNVFLRRYWYLDSVADISERYALSQSKVKTMLHRSRSELREYLEKEGFAL